ncbi:MAG: hypothetical protein AAF316_00380 [Cyanobacteria bacterium P01_A01_bin.80]
METIKINESNVRTVGRKKTKIIPDFTTFVQSTSEGKWSNDEKESIISQVKTQLQGIGKQDKDNYFNKLRALALKNEGLTLEDWKRYQVNMQLEQITTRRNYLNVTAIGHKRLKFHCQTKQN